MLVVNEIILDSVHVGTQYPHVLLVPVKIHIKMCDILQFLLHLRFHAGIFRQNNPHIIVLFVNTFRQ